MAKLKIDLLNSKFGRLTVLKVQKSNCLCKCECGNEKIVNKAMMLYGRIKSCGCLRKEVTGTRLKTHGLSGTLTYKRWKSMKDRCSETTNKSYKKYREKGILVCARWLNSFENFLIDMGDCPSKEYSLERIDNLKIYSPENCKWATKKEQARNTSRNRIIEFNGVSHCASQWAEILGIPAYKIYKRFHKGLAIKDVLKISGDL